MSGILGHWVYDTTVKVPWQEAIHNHPHGQQTATVGQLCSKLSVRTGDSLLTHESWGTQSCTWTERENTCNYKGQRV